jgi:predicted glycosyltransferase
VVVPDALPKKFAKQYCAKNTETFNGVDEVAWIKDFKPLKISNFKKPLIVVRQVESKAAYAGGKKDITQEVFKKLAKLGSIHYVERYNSQGETFGSKSGFVDSASLVANADLVITYGGTVSREAALQGVPSIAISDMARTYVNTYLSKNGFPLFLTTERKLLTYAEKYIGKKFDVRDKLMQLENPVDVIESVVKRINQP